MMPNACLTMILLIASTISLVSGRIDSQTVYKNETTTKRLKIMNMGWSDCADPATTGVKISRIEVGPEPIILPGPLQVGFDVQALKSLERGSPFYVRMQKKVSFFWVDVPCEDSDGGNRIGSCDYEDFCDHWPLPGPECSPSYSDHGIPCECPFKSGQRYAMPMLEVGEIKEFKVPAWLQKGDFRLQAWITPKGSDIKLACIKLDLKLAHA